MLGFLATEVDSVLGRLIPYDSVSAAAGSWVSFRGLNAPILSSLP